MIQYVRETGWIEGIRHSPSPNYDNRPKGSRVECLVIHGISLPPGEYGGEFIDQLFTNCLDPDGHEYFRKICDLKVSSHLLIKRTGEIVQYVPLHKRAWHAGESSFRGRNCCNDFSIGIELEGSDDELYEERQYAALVGLTEVIMAIWPGITREKIVGHADIAPGRKTDPGPAFDWKYYKSQIG